MKISGSHEGVYVNFTLEKGGLQKISEFIAISTHPDPANIKWTFPKVVLILVVDTLSRKYSHLNIFYIYR